MLLSKSEEYNLPHWAYTDPMIQKVSLRTVPSSVAPEVQQSWHTV